MNVSGPSHLGSLTAANQGLHTSTERIASGSRINTAADDAAGLAISNRFSAQINGMNQSIRNANDGVSMLQTAGAGLQNVTDGIQRLRELALQASNGTLTDNDRNAMNKEAQHLKSAIQDGIANTSFNNKPLLTNGGTTDLQVGPEADDAVSVELGDFSQLLEDSGFNDIDFSTREGATNALSALDELQEGVNQTNAELGAQMNRLDSTVSSLTNSSLNAEASRSRIKDADMAKEVSDMVNSQVKRDASIAMQVFNNQQKGNVLRLLGG